MRCMGVLVQPSFFPCNYVSSEMEKCDIVKELGCTCRLGSDEIRGSASCLPKYLYDQESQVPCASWSILWEGGLASWAEGSQQTHTGACRTGTGRKKGGRLGSIWVAQRVSHIKSTTRLVEHKEIKTYPLLFGFFVCLCFSVWQAARDPMQRSMLSSHLHNSSGYKLWECPITSIHILPSLFRRAWHFFCIVHSFLMERWLYSLGFCVRINSEGPFLLTVRGSSREVLNVGNAYIDSSFVIDCISVGKEGYCT